jgi:RNA polymerase sigma factor (sigma-70 family)
MRHEDRIAVFDRVRARHLRFLTGVLWKLTGDRERFAEAMQYALLGMWKHVGNLEGDKAKSYIYRIALSANARAWRHRIGRDGHLKVSPDRGESEDVERVARKEFLLAVRQALSRLPENQGRAIVMRYLEEKDYASIADHLGCSVPTARSHVSKAIAALRDRLAAPVAKESDHGTR